MKRSNIIKILKPLLHEILPGHSIQEYYSLPDLASNVDFVASVVSDSSAIKKLFIQVEEKALSETINTHAVLKHELHQKGIYKKDDEYWLILGEDAIPDLKQQAQTAFIKLLDKAWLKQKVSENLEKSRILRETIETLESIGISL